MTQHAPQAGPDIGFFRNIGFALVALAAITGCIALTLTLSGDGRPAQIAIASNISQPATPD